MTQAGNIDQAMRLIKKTGAGFIREAIQDTLSGKANDPQAIKQYNDRLENEFYNSIRCLLQHVQEDAYKEAKSDAAVHRLAGEDDEDDEETDNESEDSELERACRLAEGVRSSKKNNDPLKDIREALEKAAKTEKEVVKDVKVDEKIDQLNNETVRKIVNSVVKEKMSSLTGGATRTYEGRKVAIRDANALEASWVPPADTRHDDKYMKCGYCATLYTKHNAAPHRRTKYHMQAVKNFEKRLKFMAESSAAVLAPRKPRGVKSAGL